MENLEQSIKEIVKQVLNEINLNPSSIQKDFDGQNGIFSDIESAILAAEIAQKELIKMTLETRENIIKSTMEFRAIIRYATISL